jgi:hypothetical protein
VMGSLLETRSNLPWTFGSATTEGIVVVLEGFEGTEVGRGQAMREVTATAVVRSCCASCLLLRISRRNKRVVAAPEECGINYQ